MDGADPVVLRGSRQRAGRPMAFSYAPSAQGLALYVDGRKKGDIPGRSASTRGAHGRVGERGRRAGSVYGEGRPSHGEQIDISRLILPGWGSRVARGRADDLLRRLPRRVMPMAPTVAGEFTPATSSSPPGQAHGQYLHTSGTMAVYTAAQLH